jgi:hypothetical protein
MLSSTYPGLGHLASDFCVALDRHNVLRLKYVAGRFVLLVGKVVALRPDVIISSICSVQQFILTD